MKQITLHTLTLSLLLLAFDIPAVKAASNSEAYYLALNMYHEARGEGEDGMIAVGWVTLNRVNHPKYPNTVRGVVTQKRRRSCEFGWTCDGRSDRPRNKKLWQQSQKLSQQILAGEIHTDPTYGALWFFESWRPMPQWMKKSKIRKTTTLGKHSFYGYSISE